MIICFSNSFSFNRVIAWKYLTNYMAKAFNVCNVFNPTERHCAKLDFKKKRKVKKSFCAIFEFHFSIFNLCVYVMFVLNSESYILTASMKQVS